MTVRCPECKIAFSTYFYYQHHVCATEDQKKVWYAKACGLCRENATVSEENKENVPPETNGEEADPQRVLNEKEGHDGQPHQHDK